MKKNRMTQRFSVTIFSLIGGIALFFAFFSPLSATETIQIRAATVAGSWYPEDKQTLSLFIDTLLAEASPQSPQGKGAIRALIVPHAGYQFSGAGAAAGYKLIQGQNLNRVIVIGPAHYGNFQGLSIAEVTHYETPLGRIPLDLEAITQLRKNPLVVTDTQAHQREHSIEMQLPFLQHTLTSDWKLLPLLVGQMKPDDYTNAAKWLRPFTDEKTLIVISGDFTHYGANYKFIPFPVDASTQARLKQLDMGAYKKIADHDTAGLIAYRHMTGINACAFTPVMLLLHLLPENATTTLVNYATSGEVMGDYHHSVSYLTVAVKNELPFSHAPIVEHEVNFDQAEPLSESKMEWLHQLAHSTVTAVVTPAHHDIDQWVNLASSLSADLQRPSGAFVTLKKQGELRGCIGSIQPEAPLYQAVIVGAVKAAHYDPRFKPVQADEVDQLEIAVSVLSHPQTITSYEAFEVGKQGIILEKEGRRAVYLPEVAIEQGWNREQTLSHLAKKAGLPPDAWKENVKLQVFTAQSYPMKP